MRIAREKASAGVAILTDEEVCEIAEKIGKIQDRPENKPDIDRATGTIAILLLIIIFMLAF